MKKIFIFLLLLILPGMVLSQYITPTMYPVTDSIMLLGGGQSGNSIYYINGDQVESSWITVNPGYYTFGIQYSDSIYANFFIIQRVSFILPIELPEESLYTLLTKKDGYYIVGQLSINADTISGHYLESNILVTGSQIKIIVIFLEEGNTSRSNYYKYKVFFGKQPYYYTNLY